MRSRYMAAIEKRDAVTAADQAGTVCDSSEVRENLIKRVMSGEITGEQAKAELKKIKRLGKAKGMLTKSQVFNRS